MNIHNIPGQSIYVPPKQDDYSDQSYGSANDVTSPGTNRGIQFESESARATQYDPSQDMNGANSLQGPRGIEFLNTPATNQSSNVNSASEIPPNSALGLGDQMQALVDILQSVISLLAGILGTGQANSNDSGSNPNEPSSFSSPDYNDTPEGQTNPVASPYSGASESSAPASAVASNESAVTPSPTSSSGASSGASSTAPSTAPSSASSGAAHTPTVSGFNTIEPGEGPDLVKDANGKFVFNEVVDDSFLPEDVQQGMREAVESNKDLSFFQDNFNNEEDMYQYLVHMANLESGGGASLANEHDAAGSGTGGSAGYMHLHMNYGLAESSFGGAPLNTEGWSQDEVLGDYSKYTELTMKHIDGAYQSVGGDSNEEGAEQAMALWWTGNDATAAGAYYMEALSGGAGVNHNTGSAYM